MGVMRLLLSWGLTAGLAALFVGERVLAGRPVARLVVSGAGALLLVAVAVVRVLRWRRAQGDERAIARVLALGSLGTVLAVAALLVGTEGGVRFLGLDFERVRSESHFRHGFLAGGTIALAVSLLPVLAAQWALRFRPRGVGTHRADVLRVREAVAGALNVALAGSFLVLGGYVAAVHDWTLDASYFKTSSPGDAVQEIVRSMDDDLRVLLFFPDVDAVKDELVGYFGQLAAATGKVTVEQIDRLAEPGRAAEHQVSVDGTVVLLRGSRSERFTIPTDLRTARSRLRVLDGEVQGILLRLQRDRLIAYLTVGHGELNDRFRDEVPTASRMPSDSGLEALRRLLQLLSYEVRDLGLQTGLGSAVPEDASILMSVGPRRPFLPEEMQAVREYLHGGGSLLLALDPGTDFSLDGLRDDLGVDLGPGMLADEQRHLAQTGGIADRRLIVTNRISAHASATTASRRGVGAGIALVEAGPLVEVPTGAEVRTRFVVESMESTFADLDGDLRLDEGTESRGTYHLVAAVEGTGDAASAPRALVYGDADMFSDPVLLSLGMNAALVADGIRWLGREETFAGETISEADVPIVHTREENVAWFYTIILGAPALVLLVGLLRAIRPRLERRRPA